MSFCLRLFVIFGVPRHMCLVFPENYSWFPVNNSCVFNGWSGPTWHVAYLLMFRPWFLEWAWLRRPSRQAAAYAPHITGGLSHRIPHAANHYSDTLHGSKETTLALHSRSVIVKTRSAFDGVALPAGRAERSLKTHREIWDWRTTRRKAVDVPHGHLCPPAVCRRGETSWRAGESDNDNGQ